MKSRIEFFLGRAHETDMDGILELERESFAAPWSRQAFFLELISETGDHGIAKLQNADDDRYPNPKIIGYHFSRWVADEMEILKIAVHPLWRGMGVGGRLISAGLARAAAEGMQKAHLEVRASNGSAIAFYEKEGFRLSGRRKGYYAETGEDALLFTKNLKNEARDYDC